MDAGLQLRDWGQQALCELPGASGSQGGSCSRVDWAGQMDGHCASCNFGYVLKGNSCESVMVGSIIAVHNAEWSRFVTMAHNDVKLSAKRPAEGLPSERFLVLDAGKGRVLLKNVERNKVMSRWDIESNCVATASST